MTGWLEQNPLETETAFKKPGLHNIKKTQRARKA